MPSLHQASGLSLLLYAPLETGGVLLATNLADVISDYSHSIATVGGYQSASFSLAAGGQEASDWLEEGLGRHVEVYDPALERIWEGFVSRVTIQLGPLSVSRGPYMDIANRVKVAYTTATYTVLGVTFPGEDLITEPANDTDSQERYGILEMVLSTGVLASAEAEQIRDQYLVDFSFPPSSEELSLGGVGQAGVTVSVECEGYYRFFERYTYNHTPGNPLETPISTKLALVIAADPNGLFSTTNAQIQYNGFLVADDEDGQDKAWSVIGDLVARGDANDSRYIFAVLNDRQIIYDAIPTTVTYEHLLAEPGQPVLFSSGRGSVPYWRVRPGRWLSVPDFLPGAAEATELRRDPRNIFIEAVSYTSPGTLVVSGGRVDGIAQRLARLGLGSI